MGGVTAYADRKIARRSPLQPSLCVAAEKLKSSFAGSPVVASVGVISRMGSDRILRPYYTIERSRECLGRSEHDQVSGILLQLCQPGDLGCVPRYTEEVQYAGEA